MFKEAKEAYRCSGTSDDLDLQYDIPLNALNSPRIMQEYDRLPTIYIYIYVYIWATYLALFHSLHIINFSQKFIFK